jgi:hypothetical protein
MSAQKSPGGSLFPYYYKGGELYCVHLGSYGANEAGVLAMLKAEEDFIFSQYTKMGIWIDFYETKLTGRVISGFITLITHVQPRLTKLAIVGCSWGARWRINRLIKQSKALSTLPMRYDRDPEAAKTWLVSESG